MAFDACMMRAVLAEFSEKFPEAKIEKVLQPRNDEIDLVIHRGRSSSRLVFNVGPNAPRLQLSDIAKENPLKPPMFCMLLRKYLVGGRIVGVEQPGFDRIAVFKVACFDEMGYPEEKKIVCEIMGKYANLIILDGSDKILAALKIIDFSASTVRQVLPGLKYQIPTPQDKLSPLVIDKELFLSRLADFDKTRTVEKFITLTYSGIATQIARELCYRAAGECDLRLADVSAERLYEVFLDWQNLLLEHNYTPTVAFDVEGKPCDYSYMNIGYLTGYERKCYGSLGEMLDAYFAERDRLERIRQRAHDLITLLNNAISRTERKLAAQRETLRESERGEEYKRRADLITANLYNLSRGMTELETVDYYDEEAPTVKIELDPRLTPAANAQRAYKLYNKAKKAKEVLTEQIATWEAELIYLEGVQGFLERAESEEDLNELREELYRAGYSSKMKNYRSPKKMALSPMRFTTSGGFTVLVGRNNVQNDHLTFKMASKEDLWFHTKDIPGSHVILITEGKEPPAEDYTEAAGLAAYYSSATGDRVEVDYTYVKNVKKPQGSKPGFVTYKTNYTAYVKPIKEIAKQ